MNTAKAQSEALGLALLARDASAATAAEAISSALGTAWRDGFAAAVEKAKHLVALRGSHESRLLFSDICDLMKALGR